MRTGECKIEDKSKKEEERGERWRGGRKKEKIKGMKVRRENIGEADRWKYW